MESVVTPFACLRHFSGRPERASLLPLRGEKSTAADPPARFLAGSDSRSAQGSIQGSNLHETEGNSDRLKPHRNAKKQLSATPSR
jgi:hypothetical protein